MKLQPLALLTLLATAVPLRSQDQQTSTARILGELEDGTPPPLEASPVTTDCLSDLSVKRRREYAAPEIPDLPAGEASFVVTSGNPSAENLAAIHSLHDLHNNEHDELKAAFEGRERARLQRKAQQKAHPPKPKDIVLNHWGIGASTPAEGGAK